MKNLLLFLSLGFVLAYSTSCEKKPKQFSDWKINGTAYRSNNVSVSVGKGSAAMACQEPEGFSIVWYTSSGFPDRDGRVWRIADGGQGTVGLGIYRQGIYYNVSPHEIKYMRSRIGDNGGIELVVEPVWYVNYDNPADSVLIEGVFRRP
ncbi:MAG: hypothetical protein EOP54_05465 [Sphingobacteriales bacterium]|nr:MAG: hypothetical protein EOP54_05465 [Sphingobacteriales bacterium]